MSDMQIGYDSLQDVSGITVTSGNAATTYPVANAVDWLAFDYFKPDATSASVTIKFAHASAQTADYIALAKHTLGTLGARVTVEYSSDDISYSTALSATTLSDDGVFFKSFASQSAKYWKLTFDRADSGNIQPEIGMVLLGAVFDVGRGPQIGFQPPIIDGDTGNINVSVDGMPFVKELKQVASMIDIAVRYQTPSWVRTNWLPLMQHLQTKPCIVSWDEGNYSSDAVLAWVDKPSDMPQPKYSTAAHMDAQVKMKAVLA